MTTDDEGINSPSISPPTTNQSCTETSINGKEEQESPTASSRGIFATLTEAAGYIASTMRSPPPLSVDSSLEPPPVEEAADDPDAMEIEDETVSDDTETKHEEKTHVQERSNDPSSERAAVGEAVGMATSHEDKRAVEETAIIKDSMEIDSTTVIPSIEMIQEDNNGEDDEDDYDLIQEKMKKIQGTVDVLTERRLGESLDSALDALQQNISVSVSVMADDPSNRKKNNAIYASLREAAIKAYQSLVEYGSCMDLSVNKPTSSDEKDDHDSLETDAIFLGEIRRSKLLTVGENLWMIVRSNPDLFNDMISRENDESENAKGSDDFIASYEAKKHQAVAGGYVRAIAARLVFLDHIDTRSSMGCPPSLARHASTVSIKKLGFGLKIFGRAGRAILTHQKEDARGVHELLSLAVECFNVIKNLSKSNGEAVNELEGLMDEAFDTFFMLPNAASLFGEHLSESADTKDRVENWANLVVSHLKQAESFLKDHCNMEPLSDIENGEKNQSISKFATLQRYLPSLARLCYKHGSHFAKLEDYTNASAALEISLRTTDRCLRDVRLALETEDAKLDQGLSRKGKGMHIQVLHNLEADLVVVSIESFYVLSFICQSTGRKDGAISCLDQIEKYMLEQQARDDKLFSDVMNKLGQGKDFVFSEGGATSAIEGPQKQDKADIRTRAQTARIDAKSRHAKEKATLAFARIMIFHKTPPIPSLDEEVLIDKKLRELVDLSWQFKSVSRSDVSSAQYAITTANQLSSVDNKTCGDDHIFKITLQAIRVVHVRRIVAKISGDCIEMSTTDPYKILLDKFPKSHLRRPFILLDQLVAMLTASYQVRERKYNCESMSKLDEQALQRAKDFIETAKLFFEKSASIIRGTRDTDTTLFVTSARSLSDHLYQEALTHFSRTVSLYHSTKEWSLCAHWSDMLQIIFQFNHQANTTVSLENSDVLLGQVMTVKAFAQSKSGDSANGMKTAREAWKVFKSVDSIVTLFHCVLRHQLSQKSVSLETHTGRDYIVDTMLEFDDAMNELLSIFPESSGVDDILAAFPRLSNSCVENEADGGGLLLLALQERWVAMMFRSKTLQQCLKEKTAIDPPGGHSVFEVLRAYIQNFEHVIPMHKDHQKVVRHCEALVRILDGALKLLRKVRERKQHKLSGRRKKRKESPDNGVDFVLVWDDPATQKLLGDRADCIWVAEQLWNIGNRLMAVSVCPSTSEARRFASDVFAASHDFCITSEEEEGASLSKGYTDYDAKYNTEKMMIPIFAGSHERTPCDISSEFSGQCLLLSAATAVDYASGVSSSSRGCTDDETKALLRSVLHRLAQAQEEFQLNCEDAVQKNDVDKMIALLTLRCLLGVGNDSLAHDILLANGLGEALNKIHNDELHQDDALNNTKYTTLLNVYLMSGLAEETQMNHTSSCLLHICAKQLPKTGKFVLLLGDSMLSLGDIQRKLITSASSTKDIIAVYKEIDELVKKHRDTCRENSDDTELDDATFYSEDELTWFIIEAYNRGVHQSLLCDWLNAEVLFATALNLLPFGGKEVQCHAKDMRESYQNCMSKKLQVSETLSSILATVS